MHQDLAVRLPDFRLDPALFEIFRADVRGDPETGQEESGHGHDPGRGTGNTGFHREMTGTISWRRFFSFSGICSLTGMKQTLYKGCGIS